MSTPAGQNERINVITLGCAKNLVDSEVLIAQLRAGGRDVAHEDSRQAAGTVIINTCGFIDRAKDQSIQAILQYAALRQQGAIGRLYVIGCLSQRYRDDLVSQIPDVDGFFGTHDLPDLLRALGVDYREELVGRREPVTPGHYAYLKISEGCNRRCGFCAIPLMRGRQVSRDIPFLVAEAAHLVRRGVKELILIAQDLTAYGTDRYGRRRLDELLRRLADIPHLAWIRLHYAHPSGFPLEILPVIRERPNICRYLDMPIQHIADDMLRRMRRGLNRQRIEELIARIRAEVPGIALRTTVLTGHPGETEDHHAELLDFLRRQRFERLGAFQYSHEEDTPSHAFADDIPAETKQRRYDEIMTLQQRVSLEANRTRIGQTLTVLVDRRDKHHFIARTEYDSPEIDNAVLLRARRLHPGDFLSVRITAARAYDLEARPE